MDWLGFQDKVVIVTGAAQGIGEAVARAFSDHGAHVIIADLNAAGAEQLAGNLSRSGLSVRAVAVDVTDASEVTRLVRTTVEMFGGLHILINAAGGFGRSVSAEEIGDEQWIKVIHLNLTSAFLTSREATPT